MENWIRFVITFTVGIAIWERFMFIYPEIKRKINIYNKAKEQLFQSLDPILKSSDELYRHIFFLSKENFATFISEKHSVSVNASLNKKFIYYLFSQLWAHLEYQRMKNQYFSIRRIKKGKELMRFIETIESQEYRVLDRSVQRVIGESLIENSDNTFRIRSLNQFLNKLNDENSNLKKGIDLLQEKLEQTSDKDTHQRILIFSVIIVALINHFDPKHKIVRNRKIYSEKLSISSKYKIRKSLFGQYLKFTNDQKEYYK